MTARQFINAIVLGALLFALLLAVTEGDRHDFWFSLALYLWAVIPVSIGFAGIIAYITHNLTNPFKGRWQKPSCLRCELDGREYYVERDVWVKERWTREARTVMSAYERMHPRYQVRCSNGHLLKEV